ncbi:MAG: hypothetical protein EXS18_03250 [Verrucomicrobiae bacterium]|nr:hypothetical protein [Verrucomicrobiae bacterium]
MLLLGGALLWRRRR